MSIDVRLIWPTAAILGEGPLWSPDHEALFYVDIKGHAVHRYHPASGTHETLNLDARPSFVLPVEGRHMVVGSEDRLLLLNKTGLGETLSTIDMPDHNRTNDGTVDRYGRLWFGTMDDDEEQATGAIYCFVDGRLTRAGGEAVVTNGPAVSPDGETLYHVSSGQREIWRHRIGQDATLRDSELFLRIPDDQGYPDGIILDSEGCLWVALWDGWGMQRYSPSGELLLRVDLPCARVTKIALGGPDLRTAYVTTARVGLSERELAAQPLAGGLFAFDAPAPGLVSPMVKLAA